MPRLASVSALWHNIRIDIIPELNIFEHPLMLIRIPSVPIPIGERFRYLQVLSIGVRLETDLRARGLPPVSVLAYLVWIEPREGDVSVCLLAMCRVPERGMRVYG